MPTAEELRERFGNALPPTNPGPPLKSGDSGGTFDGMEARVTRLEEQFKLSDDRMGRVETKLDMVVAGLSKIPSRIDLVGYVIAVLTIFLAVVGILLAGMGWLETRASRVDAKSEPQIAAAPIVIQLPAQAAPVPAPTGGAASK